MAVGGASHSTSPPAAGDEPTAPSAATTASPDRQQAYDTRVPCQGAWSRKAPAQAREERGHHA